MEERIVKSKNLQFVRDGNMFVVWHSLFGYPQILNAEGVDLLEFFSTPKTVSELRKINEFLDLNENLDLLRRIYFLIPSDLDERSLLHEKTLHCEENIRQGKEIEYLSLIISEDCNFACKYCISNSMINASYRRKNRLRLMSLNTAIKAVDIFVSLLLENGKKEAYINFGGGEPLLNFKVIRKVLEYCKDKYGRILKFKFRLNSNISLMNRQMAEILKGFGVEIAVSLDGTKGANDAVRQEKSGRGTFERIMYAIDILRHFGHKVDGFSATVTEENFNLIDDSLIKFAKDYNFSSIRVDLDVIHLLSIPVELAIKKIMSLKRLADLNGISLTGFWERPVENLNLSILEKHIAFCGGVAGKSMCVSPSEEVFICGYSANNFAKLSLRSIKKSEKYHSLITKRLAGRISRCRGCIIEGQCIGGCHITEEFDALKKEDAIKYNCTLYRSITVELLKDNLSEARGREAS